MFHCNSLSVHNANRNLCPLQQHAHEFNTNVALYELYKYAHKYKEQVSGHGHGCIFQILINLPLQLLQILEEDEFAVKNNLPQKLEHVYSIMSQVM